jgi:mannose-6-phosphate isomerase
VHAIGAGVLLAEVQQSSDITFRLYDWGRLGTDGKPRELHIEPALDCTDFQRGPVDPVTPQPLNAGHDAEELVRCDFFVMRRHRLAADREITIPADDRFHVLMALAGSGELLSADGERRSFPRGQTVLVPAACEDVRLTSRAEPLTVLEAFLP